MAASAIVLFVAVATFVFLVGTAGAAFSFSSGTIGVSAQQSTATPQQTLTSEDKLDIASVTDAGSSQQLTEPTSHTTSEADSSAAVAVAQATITSAYATDTRAEAIDAYLASTPLAGYGATFVAAADAYGLDARLLPAISKVESGGGANCFLSCNAWGYGHYSWSSWDEAIWAVAAGISRGYGSSATPESMESVYCAAPWGSKVRACMESIY